MILTISDSEEGILNKIKSVLACESTLEVMEITNSEKLTFQGLEIDQLQRSVIKDGKVVELTRHEYDLLFYLALSPNRVFTKEQIYQHIYEDVESEVDNRVYGLVKNLRKKIEENAELLGIPIQIFDSEIFGAVYTIEQSPCYLCARMRRGYLYSHAKELGCNKIALGHHFDDVIETILMGMFYGGKVETMMPKLHSQNFEGMELIRPMYLIKEDDIIAWRDYNQLNFIQCACRFTENCVSCGGGRGSKRDEMKELIKEFRKQGDIIEKNIFRSVHNVNLRTIIGYHKDDMEYNFLDDYNERGK